MTDARDTNDSLSSPVSNPSSSQTTAPQPAPQPAETAPPRRQRIEAKRVLAILAQVIWALFALAALVLAAGALLIALDANRDNGLVRFVLDTADVLDLGIFDRDNGIKQWTGENAETKNALLNWGLAALAWLIVGKVLDKVVRPKA